jgi:hypothetical protein
VAAALLPVVEEIDPALVGDCLWHALSFRQHRPADAFLLWLQPEDNDAALAAFVARYDRGLAHALLPGVDTRVIPARDEPAYDWGSCDLPLRLKAPPLADVLPTHSI